jgi:DNA-directed RNA polymerase subunit RPC12/RpoP
MRPTTSSKKSAKTKATGVKNGKSKQKDEKNREIPEEGQEVGIAEIRTTQAGREQPEPYPYRVGCPNCGEKSLVTEQKIRTYRVCRCRECGWRGEMEG